MSIRNAFAFLLMVVVALALNGPAFAQGAWSVENTFHVGGDGGKDYITVDAQESPAVRSPKHSHDGDRFRFGEDDRGHSRPEAQPWGCSGP